jgi:TRAP-type C4-dicarboxylate transport system substrate-binding protein
MKKGSIVFALTCLSVFLIVFVMHLPVEAQVIRLKYANFIPPSHKNAVHSEQFCKEIEKRTAGRVKIIYLATGTFVSAPQIYDSTIKGICDIGHSATAYSAGRFPLSEALDLPLGSTSGIQATRLANAFYKKFKPKELDETKLLYFHAPGPGLFHTKKVVSGIDDIKGMRIKANASSAKIIKAVGGSPVTMPISETYDALQKGLVDGIALNTDTLKSLKYADHIHCTLENTGVAYTTALFVVMNKEKWNQLPPDIQNIFEQVSREYAEKMGQAWDEADLEAKSYAIKKGHKFVPASKEQVAKAHEKMKPIMDEYLQRMKAKNLPGEEALKFCEDWLRANP